MVEGYDKGTLVGSQTFTLNYKSKTLLTFDQTKFRSIDTITFISSGGTDASANDNGLGNSLCSG